MEIMSLSCPKCGADLPDQVTRGRVFKCSHCGGTLVWPDRRSTLTLSFGVRLCPVCGADNEQIREFCKDCGSVLIKICPRCDSRFYVGDRFCPKGHDYDSDEIQAELIVKQEHEKQTRKDTILQQVNSLAMSGNYEQAANILEESLKLYPNFASIIAGYPKQTYMYQEKPVSGYALLVHLSGKADRKDLAVKYFERMLELIPQNPGHARQAAREAGISKEAKMICKQNGIPWNSWDY